MPAPLGWNHRHRPGIVGTLARWHVRRHTARVRAALAAHKAAMSAAQGATGTDARPTAPRHRRTPVRPIDTLTPAEPLAEPQDAPQGRHRAP